MALRMSRPLYVGSYLQVTWEVLGQRKGRKHKRRCTHPEFWKKRKISLVWCKTSHKQIVPRTAKKCTNLCKDHDDLSHKSYFAWRHFTTTTRILQDFAFVSKLEVLLFLLGLPNLNMKGKTGRILVIVKWRHYAQPRPQGFSLKKWVAPHPIFKGKAQGTRLHYANTKRCFRAIALICKTVRMYAQAVKQKVWSEAEKGERVHERVRLVASRVWDS